MDAGQQINNGGKMVALHEWRLKNLEDDVQQILSIQGKILHSLDTLPCNERNARLKMVERDVEHLKNESRVWNSINSIAATVAGLIGIQIK